MRPSAAMSHATSRFLLTATIALVFAFALAPPSFAASRPDIGRVRADAPDFRADAKHDWVDSGDRARDDREGGESIETAIVIPDLPFNDTGATCDNLDDYDEACPFPGSTSPDVVYAFTPHWEITLFVDLCGSSYDTKVYIYADDENELVACNDDAGCGSTGYQSQLPRVVLTPERTYYIVIDGYGGSCGSYSLTVTYSEPCAICPPDGVEEGEPPCVNDYADEYNSGCGGHEMNWTPIVPAAEGCATMCGRSCTFLYHGLSYRDTDWFECEAEGGPVTVECLADFPVQIFFFHQADCDSLLPDTYVVGDPCETVRITTSMPEKSIFWIWVGPSVYNGIPERPYVLDVCGIRGCSSAVPDPTDRNDFQKATWGRVKQAFGERRQ